VATEEQTSDVLVLGAGSTGENAADIAVRGGLGTAMVAADRGEQVDTADGSTGTAIAVVDTERVVLLGVPFVGEVPLSRLGDAVASYSPISEVSLRLVESYRG
jgi:dihydrolipoamide dehydrogenase